MKQTILKLMAILAGLFLTLFAVQALACDHAAGKDCGCQHAASQAKDVSQDAGKAIQGATKDSDKVADKASPKLAGFDKLPAVGTKATCPVSGEEFTVTKDTVHSEYKGKFYVFCCAGCKPKFDADPTKYIK